MPRKIAAFLALALAAALVFAATLPEERRSWIDTRGPLHPYVHVIAFTLIALLGACSARSAGVRVLLCAAVALLGCSTEVIESRMFHNPLEWADIILDAMGAVIGTSLGAFAENLVSRRTG